MKTEFKKDKKNTYTAGEMVPGSKMMNFKNNKTYILNEIIPDLYSGKLLEFHEEGYPSEVKYLTENEIDGRKSPYTILEL